MFMHRLLEETAALGSMLMLGRFILEPRIQMDCEGQYFLFI